MSQEPDRRLHPLSLLFLLGGRLKDLLVPMIFALFATRSSAVQVIAPAIIAVIATVSAVLQYFSYRYRYGDDDLVVRTGVFNRNERHIPYTRIQNVDAVQNVLHRFLGVAVVQVQTGSGSEPEATLSVLPVSELAVMRQRVQAERAAATSIPPTDLIDAIEAATVLPPVPPKPLLHLPSRELLLAGFIENRGMALVLAGLAVLAELNAPERVVGAIAARFPGAASEWLPGVLERGGPAAVATGVAALLLAALAFVRMLSTVWAVVRLHDYRLVRDGDDFRAEYGLFTRVTSTIPLRRIQTISVHQGWLHRKLGRAGIRVTTAGASGVPGAEARSGREWLAPIIPVGEVRTLLHEIDPGLELGDVDWTPVHPRAPFRIMRVSATWIVPIVIMSAIAAGPWSVAIGGIVLLWGWARARGIALNAGCAILGERVAFRGGWITRIVSVARFDRIQTALLTHTPWDRRNGMASIGIDTAGMGSSTLSMRYLPDSVAARLHDRLARAAATTPFTW